MLSYIHAFHSGNTGDILKHIVLTLTIDNLLKKDKPFSVIDTHSAQGLYSLNDERIKKTGEAETGIRKLLKSNELNSIRTDIGSYLKVVEKYFNLEEYPGSPEISRCLMRCQDDLLLNELHPQIIEELKLNMKKPLPEDFGQNPHIAIHNKDASAMLNSTVPPKTKRGCVIIDPSYEDSDDYDKTAEMFIKAYSKWSTPSFLIWYPLIEHRIAEITRMKSSIQSVVEQKNTTQEEKTLFFELKTKDPSTLTGLSKMYGSGMIAVNPVYGLEEKMNRIIPVLTSILAE